MSEVLRAAGKSALAVECAERYDGEVISADSRQVYRGLDVGTGKITEKEMRGIPHMMLDVADPRERYTAFNFGRDAYKCVIHIQQKNKLPIVVGGSGFYIHALRYTDAIEGVPAANSEGWKRKINPAVPAYLYCLVTR